MKQQASSARFTFKSLMGGDSTPEADSTEASNSLKRKHSDDDEIELEQATSTPEEIAQRQKIRPHSQKPKSLVDNITDKVL